MTTPNGPLEPIGWDDVTQEHFRGALLECHEELKRARDGAAELRAAALEEVVDVIDAVITDRQARVIELGNTDSLADRINLGASISAFKEAREYVVALQRGEQPLQTGRKEP